MATLCALSITVLGCAGDVGGDTTLGTVMCQTGQVQACTCPDGSTGNRECLAGGRATACMCTVPGGQNGGAVPGPTTPGGTAGEEVTGGETVDPGVNDPVEEPVGMDPVEDPGTVEEPTAPIASVDVPTGSHCAPVADWDPLWAQWENEVLVLTNEVRARGANCDTEGSFGPVPALTMNAELRCSARLHSLDMGQNDYFSHYSQDGTDAGQRMQAAGYAPRALGENIAAGQTSPQEVVDGWVDSDGHCANIMQSAFTELGVGYYEQGSGWTGARMWTQNFGTPGGGGFGWN